MSAKYTRVPASDPELGHDISLDFSSSFTYNNPALSTNTYKSIYTYGDYKYQMDQSVSVGKYYCIRPNYCALRFSKLFRILEVKYVFTY